MRNAVNVSLVRMFQARASEKCHGRLQRRGADADAFAEEVGAALGGTVEPGVQQCVMHELKLLL